MCGSAEPGVFRSINSCDRPRWRSSGAPDVRTSAIIQCEWSALVVQIFWPFRRHPLAVGVARVRTLARSEPACGSLMPIAKNSSPRQTAGTKKRFCASVLNAPEARLVIVLAALEAKPETDDVAAFLVETDQPGWRAVRLEERIGLHGASGAVGDAFQSPPGN